MLSAFPPLAWVRRHILLSLSVAAVPAFVLTAFLVGHHRQAQRNLAAEWTARGDHALAAGSPADAIAAYRNALTFSRDNRDLLLNLARALHMAGRDTEARAYLLTLWSDQPGNGPINLELARLAAGRQDVTAALRYYHGAIEGSWPRDAEAARRAARFELARFLVASDAHAAARVEITAIEQDLPPEIAGRLEVASLMRRSGMDDRALQLYRQLLAEQPKNSDALAAAGTIAFERGTYQTAIAYLSRAIAAGDTSPELRARLETAQGVLTLDPFLRRLTQRERASRVARAFGIAADRLAACPEDTTDRAIAGVRAEAAKAEPALRRNLSRDPDLIESTMDLVERMQRAAADCRPPAPLDTALLLIAQQRQRAEQ